MKIGWFQSFFLLYDHDRWIARRGEKSIRSKIAHYTSKTRSRQVKVSREYMQQVTTWK